MYDPYYNYVPHVNQYTDQPYRGYTYVPQQYLAYNNYHPYHPAFPEEPLERQQAVRGQATWTEGGPVTECGIPWSANDYMTVAVGANAPYRCGQTLKVRNLSTPEHKEIYVKVVDEVMGYPSNRINLHRRAFEALGSNLQVGVINIEISPAAEQPQPSKWGAYLSSVVKVAFPDYNITDYHAAGKAEVSAAETAESFQFALNSSQETRHVKGIVHYNPRTNRVISVELKGS